MPTNAHLRRIALGIALGFGASALMACGGMDVPLHNGYRKGKSKPWTKPKVLEFDEDFEAEDDGELSYSKRRRARWMAVDLPDDGEIDVVLEASPISEKAEEEDFEDEEDPFDVAFEIYDENYKVLASADRESDDAGDRKRDRTATKLLEGRYLIHIFLQRRLDEAEYNLRVKYRRVGVEAETNFPDEVAFVEPLPVVPAFDDAPERIARCKGRKCRKGKGKKPKNGGGKKPKGKDPDAVPAGAITARIIGVRQAPSGTHITINVGESRGIERGWKGRVITKKGKAIPGGQFTIKKVTARTASATVGASPDSVTGAKRVRISPP